MSLDRLLALKFLIFLLFASPAWASDLTFKLSVKKLPKAVEFSGHGVANNCTVTIFGSSSEHGFRSSALRLLALRPVDRQFLVSLPLSLISKIGGTVFLKAKAKCPTTQRVSQVEKLRPLLVKTSSNKSVKDFLVELRQQSLRSLTKIVPAFKTVALAKPVDLQTVKGDLRTFVVEQDGVIKAISTSSQMTDFLNISSRVSTSGERGLLGLAFDPDFSSTKRFYINYTRPDGGTIISRMIVDPFGNVNPDLEEILLSFEQPIANHNGGALAFGPDKFLYIASGDGGSGGPPNDNGQNLQTFLGKILRIDVSVPSGYQVPLTNPFIHNLQSYKEEIYAYGLRNPWRISFDGENLFAGELGQDTTDEIDLIKNGANYGWKIKEGSNCFENPSCSSIGFIDPISEYGRDIGRSVTGGYVSRDEASPNLNGVYIFGDFINGKVFALEKMFGKWIRTEIADTSHFISSFGRGNKQEIFFLSYSDGKVFRVLQK